MPILTGAALVLATWAVAIVVLLLLGALPTMVLTGGTVNAASLRRSLWWGLLLLATCASLIATAIPLRSAKAVAAIGILFAVAVVGLALMRPRWRVHLAASTPAVLTIAACVTTSVVLAAVVLGPVTNYDSGLYHLGAIRYASEFPTIPGLANLFGPLGYGSSEFTLAALLGNGPLGLEGFRALNGLILSLVMIDLIIRVLRRQWSAGTWVLLVSTPVALAPMVVMADYWLTSPTQDSAVLFLTLACVAYFVDAIAHTRQWGADAATALGLGLLMCLVRPTMLVMAAAVLVVLVGRTLHLRRITRTRLSASSLGLVSAAAALAASAGSLRDALLSGWVQYPLSVLPFPVPWRVPNPSGLREATLGYWRNPADIWGSVSGWAWVGPWLADLPRHWETVLLATLLCAAALIVTLALRNGTVRLKALLLAMTPSLIATALWWLASPPGFRFAWGPLFTLLTIPLGWAAWRLTKNGEHPMWPLTTATVGAVVVLLACVAIVGWRMPWRFLTENRHASLGPFVFEDALAPIPKALTKTTATESGLRVQSPVATDQCWAVFPLCTPAISPGVRLLGTTESSGFLP